MTLVLYYKIGKDLVPFYNKLQLAEYYITNNFEDYKIFIKDTDLPITEDEAKILLNSDFCICLPNGTELFTKNEISLTKTNIRF